MSCLAPAPLSDLVTKDHLSAELSRFATKEEMQAGFDALAAQRGQTVKRWTIASGGSPSRCRSRWQRRSPQ